MTMHDVAVVGAGWAGLTAARSLRDEGLDVVVLEKSRGPGGRSATRRQDGFAFDHGAQYFTARDPAFSRQVEVWREAGLVAAWQPRLRVVGSRPDDAGSRPAERLVALPGMNGVAGALADGLDCRFGWAVEAIGFDGHWTLGNGEGETLSARKLVLTPPPRQSAALLGENHPLFATLDAVVMTPCLALMVGFDEPLAVDFDAAFINRGPLSWLARNSSKPGRQGEAWVAHASADWSRRHLDCDPETIAGKLLPEVLGLLPEGGGREPALVHAHRWRYAMAPEPLERSVLISEDDGAVLAGDWCAGNRIEGAWRSGRAAADSLKKL